MPERRRLRVERSTAAPPLTPADPRAAFDAMRALEDVLLSPAPDPQAALDAARALEEAIVGKRGAP